MALVNTIDDTVIDTVIFQGSYIELCLSIWDN